MDHSGYGPASRLLHWLMAALIFLTVPAGLVMMQAEIDRSLQNALFIFHKNVGVLLLLLVALRLVLRWRKPPMSRAVRLPRWQELIASTTHSLLYGLLIIVPIAGYVRVRAGGYPIEALDMLRVPTLVPRSDDLAATAKALHYFAGLAIIVSIALHVGAALFHRLVKKDDIFSRMWPPLGPRR